MEFKATVVAKDGRKVTFPITFESLDKAWMAVRASVVKQGLEVWFPKSVTRLVESRPVKRRNWEQRDIHRPFNGGKHAGETVAVAFVYPADTEQSIVDAQIAESTAELVES